MHDQNNISSLLIDFVRDQGRPLTNQDPTQEYPINSVATN